MSLNTPTHTRTHTQQGYLQIVTKDGSNNWWLALLPKNVGGSGAVTNMEIRQKGASSWTPMQRQPYNYWLVQSGSGLTPPLEVRVSQGRQQITGTIQQIVPSQVTDLGQQFAGQVVIPSHSGAPLPSPSVKVSPTPSSQPSSSSRASPTPSTSSRVSPTPSSQQSPSSRMSPTPSSQPSSSSRVSPTPSSGPGVSPSPNTCVCPS